MLPVFSTSTKPSDGGVTPKSVHVTGIDPCTITDAPDRWIFSVVVADLVTPLMVISPVAWTACGWPDSGTDEISTG